ncbi:MAG: aldehyde dehydrogenase family protein [Armatimonadetes bacterium]|nr:aldehyde dehydrogenase family protein [Armatimonadota bacterium]
MLELSCFVAGEAISSSETLSVINPYNKEVVGIVTIANRTHVEAAIQSALSYRSTLTRYQRYDILMRVRQSLQARAEEFAQLITAETGLAIREARYELGRCADVLMFAAHEAMRDDGQTFSGDVSPIGKSRKIVTTREPHALVVAITPFNHPMNQVLHKLAPAVAAGAPLILKPSEKTPLCALQLAQLFYEAGLPPQSLSVLLGRTEEVATPLVQDSRVEVLAFTGSVSVGKTIAKTAGYKKLVLELGGNDPLIVLEDADLDLAATLACEGSFRNSGQRCTAIKRILVQESVREEFTERMVERAKTYLYGDPTDPATVVGTVIDEASAIRLEAVVQKAAAQGAKVLLGGTRRGALLAPTVIACVPRDADMIVQESFGPLAPILGVRDLEDAVEFSNSSGYGLSAAIVTRDIGKAVWGVKNLRVGMVNINDVPSYRVESQPFGGVKDSGLGVKEGVIETMRYMTYVKTFSIPW